jgi:hypothetical protein
MSFTSWSKGIQIIKQITTLPLHEKLNVRGIIASKNQFLKIGIRTLAKSLIFF